MVGFMFEGPQTPLWKPFRSSEYWKKVLTS